MQEENQESMQLLHHMPVHGSDVVHNGIKGLGDTTVFWRGCSFMSHGLFVYRASYRNIATAQVLSV